MSLSRIRTRSVLPTADSDPKPIPRRPTRSSTIFSRPSNAPPQMKRTLVVSIETCPGHARIVMMSTPFVKGRGQSVECGEPGGRAQRGYHAVEWQTAIARSCSAFGWRETECAATGRHFRERGGRVVTSRTLHDRTS